MGVGFIQQTKQITRVLLDTILHHIDSSQLDKYLKILYNVILIDEVLLVSLWNDITYAKLVAHKLEGWKIKKDSGGAFLSNFRCPICGDSSKKQTKRRGYLYNKQNRLMYSCHNCGINLSFPAFLKEVDVNVFSKYNLEKYRDKTQVDSTLWVNEPKLKEVKPEEVKSVVDLVSIDDLDDNHFAKKYLVDRKIPERLFHELKFAPEFFKWTERNSDKFKIVNRTTFKDHPRLIIPWYDNSNMLFAYSARAFGKESPKYYNIVLDETKPKIYGLNRIDRKKKLYVVEGQIDSMFIPNSVAIGNAALYVYSSNDLDMTYIPDKDIRNKEVMMITNRMINRGLNVCMLPHHLKGKDINEIVMNENLTETELMIIINDNTFSGPLAKLKFTRWSKV